MAFKDFLIKDFSGGQVDAVEPSLLDSNQAEKALNVMVNTIGRLSPRPGQSTVGVVYPSPIQGLHAYYHGSTLQFRRVMAACNGDIYYGDMSGEFNLLKAGWDGLLPVQFETCINYVVMFNGKNQPMKWDGDPQNELTPLANAPNTGKCPLIYAEKLFVIVDHDTIRWSDSFEPESWPDVNYWDFGKGDGDKLTGMTICLGDLLIFKNRSIYRLVGTSLDDFRSDKVEKRHGAVCQRGIVSYDPYVYYIGDSGIFKWNGFEAKNLIEPTLPNLWKRVNKSALENSCAIRSDKDILLFALPLDEETDPNIVLALDTRYDSFWVWDNIKPKDWLMFDDGNKTHILFGHDDGSIIKFGDCLNDRGQAIVSEWIGKNFDDGASSYVKKAKKAFISDIPGVNNVDFYYKVDNGEWIKPEVVTDIDGVRRFSISSSFRYFQPRFLHNKLNEEFSITEFNMQYFRVKAK